MPNPSHLIGFFCDTPMIGSGFLGLLQTGLMAGCRKWDCALLLKAYDLLDCNIGGQVKTILERSPLRGAVLPEPLCDRTDLLDTLVEAGLPVVRIAPQSPSDKTLDICVDHEQAAYDMTAYLIGLGHKEIGFVKGPVAHPHAVDRFAGFCRAMKDAGLPVNEAFCVQSETFDYSTGLIAGRALLAKLPLPTAVFACNDDIALAVLAVAREKGLSIPEDLSLVGFDDTPLARLVWPALTTCRQKMELIGYTAIDFLMNPPTSAEARKRPQQHDLVIRQSTAAPRA